MTGPVLLDTGPLVALLSPQEPHHEWVKQQLGSITAPLLTCEAVLSEACFLLRKTRGGAQGVLGLVRRGVVAMGFALVDEEEAVEALLKRYEDLPISFADACLVRLAEKTPGATVLTLDRHFTIYRIHGRRTVRVRMPT